MRPSILYVSNLAYPAKGRRYCDEDITLTSHLRTHFDIAICHPEDATALMHNHDTVVIRNSGPIKDYEQAYQTFRTQAKATNQRVYNPLTGKGDMAGKQYLIDLTNEGYPVIPTVDTAANLDRLDRLDHSDRLDHFDRLDHSDPLPRTTEYVVKPKAGADSHGLEFVTDRDLLATLAAKADANEEVLIQPKIDFQYEVSFYFVDHDFQYALNAPDPAQRWELSRYEPTDEDLEFAQRFVDWNDLDHGVQRVDACRTRQGDLLLVELEDLNPYLSLDRTTDEARARFTEAMAASIRRSLD